MTSFLASIRRRGVVRRLQRVFERSDTSSGRWLPIRKTGRGVWAGTPVRVVAEAAWILNERGLLTETRQAGCAIDAGSGDGRALAVLATLRPSPMIYGIEADSTLHAQAVTNLGKLSASGLIDPTRVRLLEGDYCDVDTYRRSGIALEKVGLIINYPDGNQRQLARFVADHCGGGTTLCLLTHDRALEIDELELRSRHDVSDGTGPPWRLSLYRRPSSGTIGC